ncbi:NGK_0946 family protein [Neisseriaceae bacterium B1]
MIAKKALVLAIVAVMLSACSSIGSGEDNSGNINRVRSKNGMMISDAQAKQQRRQRESELEEAAARNAKTQMGMSTAREGISTVRDGMYLIQQIKSIF